jgi:hypothetical protein
VNLNIITYFLSNIDVDECIMAKDICGKGTCENIPGSFRCNCHPGYEADLLMESCSGMILFSVNEYLKIQLYFF